MKLRNCVKMLSAKRTNEVLEEKRSDNKVVNKKENMLNKKYNLRVHDKLDNEKKSFNHNMKTLNKNNRNENKAENCAIPESDIQGKENKMKKRSKRDITTSSCSSKFKSFSSVRLSFQEKFSCTYEDRKKITGVVNVNRNSGGKKSVTHKKDIKCKKINDKVPLSEISNGQSETDFDRHNGFVNNKGITSEYTVKHTEKLPVWKKKPDINKTKYGKKRKSFVDVYDIAQDEDMSNETKHKKRKLNSQKNVKSCTNRNKCRAVSNKNVNFNKKCSSNISKPVQNKPIKFAANHQSNDIGNNPTTVKVNTSALSSDKKLEIVHISDTVNVNQQNYIISALSEVGVDVTTEQMDIDNVPTNPKSLDNEKNFLLNLADELEKSLLIPRMTSTPDSSMLTNPGTKHPLDSKMTVLEISKIVSKDKKCMKLPVKIYNSIPGKETDITLFESPVKKPKQKELATLKSPKKNVQMNLFDNFAEYPKAGNLKDSVLKPKKAYHSPDNFKTHLARTKRISEVAEKVTKKSKEEIIIEKMAQHFDEVSSTELCIE